MYFITALFPLLIVELWSGSGANRSSTLQSQSPDEGISTGVLAGAIVAAFFGASLCLGLLMFIAYKRSWWPFRRRYMPPTEQAAHVCETCQHRDLAPYAGAKGPEVENGRRHELASNSMQY